MRKTGVPAALSGSVSRAIRTITTGGISVANQTSVDRSAMAAAAQQIEDAVTSIQGIQSRLGGYHSDLQGGWQGQAATAFTNAYEGFSANFTKVINALRGMHENLTATHSTYMTTEQNQTQAANRVDSLLNG
jgi:WXG100 family type VII secretion target